MTEKSRKPQQKSLNRFGRKSQKKHLEDREVRQVHADGAYKRRFRNPLIAERNRKPPEGKSIRVDDEQLKTLNQRALEYWNNRKNWNFIQGVREMVNKYCPNAQSFLEVGAKGSRLLATFDGTKVATDCDLYGMLYLPADGVKTAAHDGNLKQFEDESFDVVLFINPLDHNQIEWSDLFRIAKKIVIIGLPYRWKDAGSLSGLDELWLKDQTQELPITELKVYTDGRNRALAVYKIGE